MKRLICLALIMFACISGCGPQPKPSIGWPQGPKSQNRQPSKDYRESLRLLFGQSFAIEHQAGSQISKIIPADKFE